MANREPITAGRLRELLDYDPATGLFAWRKKSKARWRERVGCSSTQRHTVVNIGVDYRRYKAHRLAWLWMTGEWPASEIDHINRNPLDNRWCNLRLSNPSHNHRNHGGYKNNTSGTTGVIWDKSGNRWIVRMNGKHFGSFSSKEVATRLALQIRMEN